MSTLALLSHDVADAAPGAPVVPRPVQPRFAAASPPIGEEPLEFTFLLLKEVRRGALVLTARMFLRLEVQLLAAGGFAVWSDPLHLGGHGDTMDEAVSDFEDRMVMQWRGLVEAEIGSLTEEARDFRDLLQRLLVASSR